MKKLEDFKRKVVTLDSIKGGSGGVVLAWNGMQTQNERNTSADGQCCELQQDSFNDSNGNGVWDDTIEPGNIHDWYYHCN